MPQRHDPSLPPAQNDAHVDNSHGGMGARAEVHAREISEQITHAAQERFKAIDPEAVAASRATGSPSK